MAARPAGMLKGVLPGGAAAQLVLRLPVAEALIVKVQSSIAATSMN